MVETAQLCQETVRVAWLIVILMIKVRDRCDLSIDISQYLSSAIIERRCCWTNCGPSNSVMMYEGMETYFCTGDGCNRYGVEYALSPPGEKTDTALREIILF